jgi:MFS family permease
VAAKLHRLSGEIEDMATAQQQPAGSAFSKKQILMAISGIFVGYFVYSYFMQTLNVAAPRIAADLNSMALYSWSVSIPSLGLALGTLLAGKLSDIFGRRTILLGSMIIALLGAILSGISPTFMALIAARTVLFLGLGILAPLCYTVIGDLFMGAADRSRWVGLLNIPFGLPTLFGPTLSGWFVDNLGWRHIFWWALPLTIVCIAILYGMPALMQGAARKIDVLGAILVAAASSCLIFGLSFAGTTYPWGSKQVIGLLAFAIILGLMFLKAESNAEEPFLDPELLKSRIFMTASIAGFLSFFGMTGMTLYFPLFLQGIQGISAMKSGLIITPFSVLMAFIGVPTGFLLARTKRYKWMLIAGYALITAVPIGMIFFGQNTPVFWGVIAATLGGLGLGTIPTINTLVIQAAVPRKLLGVAMGALFFSIALGMAVAPAIQGSAMNIKYNNTLKASLPAAMAQVADEKTMASLGDPRVLLSETAMNALRETLQTTGDTDQTLFKQTVQAIRTSMESGLRMVFVIAAITALLAFLLILTIPKISMDGGSQGSS